ncbi:MAG: SurA N-terminal domain-containing protein [Thiohalocapsa sp.]
MLLEIRERAKGWVAWAIVILISIPFALWGIQSYLGVGGETIVAKVDGTEITEQQFGRNVQRTRMQLRERLGAAYDPELFGGQRLRQQVLDGMIADAVLLNASHSMGLRVSDQAVRAAILGEPAFQLDGSFDKATYERALRLQGLTPAGYEEQLRRRLLSTQLARAVSATEFVTPGAVESSTRLLRQKREVSFVVLPRAEFSPEAAPSDDEMLAYYESNRAAFETPEQVRVSYVLLDAQQLSSSLTAPTEEELQTRYDERIDDFVEPEQRRIRHILLTVPMDADDAAGDGVKRRALEIRERILAGEDFAVVAGELSEDPASSTAGGDLGLVGRGIMDPAFEQAAFDLAIGSLSEPVRSRFGYHLIEVTDVQGGSVQAFEAVREQLETEATAGQSEAIFFDIAERLANLAYESPDSLIPAAETLELRVQTSDWFDRRGGEGVFANPKVTAAAFSEDVLTLGNNSELMEPDPEVMQAIVLRVDEHRPASVEPLEAVRDQVAEALNQQKAAIAALEAAESMVQRLESGEDMASVVNPFELQTPGAIGRTAPEVPQAVLELAFRMPRPAEGQRGFASGDDPTGDALVVALSKVVDGDAAGLDERAREAEARVLADGLGRSAYGRLLEDLETRARIERSALPADIQ